MPIPAPGNVRHGAAFFRVKGFAMRGMPAAQHRLGFMYFHGDGVPRELDQALHWYALAARQGYAAAQYNLGSMLATVRARPAT